MESGHSRKNFIKGEIMADYKLTTDDDFAILLHKKTMDKKGSNKRRLQKYYKDQYKKNGIIPKALLLVKEGIMDGRKCSGRPRSLDEKTQKRFVEMVKTSSDPLNDDFIFITQKARNIKNYHYWLEEEMKKKISINALRRCVKREGLKYYINKPDFENDIPVQYYFKSEPVFDLVQMDGCVLRYLKIKDDDGKWKKPQVIEFYDTGSRYMFILDAYFSESSLNSVDLFIKFLTGTEFPQKKICIRPDNAKGFLNLARVINALNLEHSIPNGFYMKPDFSRINAPKDKAHLESSHRSLHNFEIRIIKEFKDKIVKTAPGYIFNHNKQRVKVTITYLDITLYDLKKSSLIEEYRYEHNNSKHYFSENGQAKAWVPKQKFTNFFTEIDTLTFSFESVKKYMKYGFQKIQATVSKKKTIRYANQDYYVAIGADLFSSHKSTRVQISCYNDKLFIFEAKKDGIFLGEAFAKKEFDKPVKSKSIPIETNELDKITDFLKEQNMVIDRLSLIGIHQKGLTLIVAKEIFQRNQKRYIDYTKRIKLSHEMRKGAVLFRAFILDCQNYLRRSKIIPYASYGGK